MILIGGNVWSGVLGGVCVSGSFCVLDSVWGCLCLEWCLWRCVWAVFGAVFGAIFEMTFYDLFDCF